MSRVTFMGSLPSQFNTVKWLNRERIRQELNFNCKPWANPYINCDYWFLARNRWEQQKPARSTVLSMSTNKLEKKISFFNICLVGGGVTEWGTATFPLLLYSQWRRSQDCSKKALMPQKEMEANRLITALSVLY